MSTTTTRRNPKDSIKSTWRLDASKDGWTLAHHLFGLLDIHQSDLSAPPAPVHPKSRPVPHLPNWQLNAFVLFWGGAAAGGAPGVLRPDGPARCRCRRAYAYYGAGGDGVRAARAADAAARGPADTGTWTATRTRATTCRDATVGQGGGVAGAGGGAAAGGAGAVGVPGGGAAAVAGGGGVVVVVVAAGAGGGVPDRDGLLVLLVPPGDAHEVPALWRFHRTHHLTKHPNALLTIFADAEQELFDVAVIPALAYYTMRRVGLGMGFYAFWMCHMYVWFTELLGHSGLRVHLHAASPIAGLLAWAGMGLALEDHDLHHRTGWRASHNYGKQSRVWDRLFGTCAARIECDEANVDYDNVASFPLF